MSDLFMSLINFLFNLIITIVLVRCVYYPRTHSKPYVFTFIAFSTIIYFVLTFLNRIEIGIGVGFGLFAIFSILRYRTDPIPIREMTYLFVIAAIPVMNALGITGQYWLELLAANVAVLIIMYILEKEWGFHYEVSKQIIYEKIELILPERKQELLADLEARLGVKVKRVSIGKVDFLRDIASIKIHYDDPMPDHWENGTDSNLLTVTDPPVQL